MPNVEFKRKLELTRQEAGERLIALGTAMAAGSEVELVSSGDSVTFEVASRVRWELEIEIDGNETEVEIEMKWADEPARKSTTAAPASGETADGSAEAATAAPLRPPARRGRPRKPPAA